MTITRLIGLALVAGLIGVGKASAVFRNIRFSRS